VSAEGGQSADTIEYANLTKMLSRLWPGSFNNAIWLASVSTIPQLLALTIEVGTAGGSHYPVLSESKGQWRLLTRPIVFTEHMSVLGDLFDIALCDFSQYVIGLRQGMRFDTSIHVHFQTDELLARLIERHDGQPLWSEALTLEDGSTTVSPFVTLAERA
jgi:HK97 family phage major capsid protein